MSKNSTEKMAWEILDSLSIVIPSWGFANTGTRFGKFVEAAAATTFEEKLSDAAQVSKFTGVGNGVALCAGWDFPAEAGYAPKLQAQVSKYGLRVGTITPNTFEDQIYKYGSFGHPDSDVRKQAVEHVRICTEIGQGVGCRDITLWFGDGSNYPGTANMRHRQRWFEECLSAAHGYLGADQRLQIEYKPFEPAFYHTDIGDWGMALLLARAAGPRAKVLVDMGHHFRGQNIEQIVAWLINTKMLGAFHLGDCRYADDDLTLGTVDPYQLFRIFHEVVFDRWETGHAQDVTYVIDHSSNLKVKVEEMIQAMMVAQEVFAKAACVDHARLTKLQKECSLIDAEECFRRGFSRDVEPILREWRRSKGLPEDPLGAFRESGYLAKAIRERSEKNLGAAAARYI
jgi:L-rhamnose isomerase/sugar isomerase